MPDPLDFAQWEDGPPQGGDNPVDEGPADRPTEWNGKPIPENALWEEDGVTPKLTPSGRIRRTRGSRTQTSSTKAKASDLNAIKADLVELFAFGAVSSAPLLPTLSLVLVERGEVTADAIVTLAKDKPRMLASIQRAAKFGPVVVITQTGLQIFIAVSLDLNRAPWDNPLAMMTGVSQKYQQTHPNAPHTTAPDGPRPPHMAGGTSTVPPYVVKDMPVPMTDPEHARYAFAGHAGPGDNGEESGAPDKSAFMPHGGGTFGNPFPA